MLERFETVEQVLDYAIDRELNSHLFYKKLAALCTAPDLRELLENFALQELGHQKKLAQVKQGRFRRLNGDTPAFGLGIAEQIPDEIEPYPDMSMEEALLFAMNKEKMAYRMYLELALDARTEDLSDLFMILAHEEANHKVELSLLRRQIFTA